MLLNGLCPKELLFRCKVVEDGSKIWHVLVRKNTYTFKTKTFLMYEIL